MQPNRISVFFQRLQKLPSFAWIIIFLVGLVALIGSIIGLFYLLSHVEGVASVIMLLAGWGTIQLMTTQTPESISSKSPGKNIVVALGIGFFCADGHGN